MKLQALASMATLLLAAGCIAAPEPEDTFEPAQTPAAEVRIDGMTVAETHTDSIVDCNDGGTPLFPTVCAERILIAEGRIGVDHFPIDLIGSNGDIEIVQSVGDAWRFTATVRVQALTEDLAREGLDTAWTWGHEKDGAHAIYAGPTGAATIPLGPTASVVGSAYRLEIPAWTALELHALTDNGGITAEPFTFGAIDVETDNGAITLGGAAESLRGRTDNGAITATLEPVGSGTWDLATDNGQIVLTVPEGRAYGYDISGTTDNGQIVLNLRDGEAKQTEGGATFRTHDYAARGIQVAMTLASDNGQIVVHSG